MKLRIKTPIYIFNGFLGDDLNFVPEESMKELNGKVYEDEVFIDYLDEPFYSMGISGGRLILSYCTEKKKMYVQSDFVFPKELNEREVKKFVSDINGQISDGMGSNFFQELSGEIMAEIEMADCFESSETTSYEVLP